MSIDLITEVRRRLDVSGGELLVAIELVDAANDKGEGIFVGVKRMARRSRQDPRTVHRQLKHLVEVGWLQVVKRGGGRRPDGSGITTVYRINPAWLNGGKLSGFPDYVCPFDDDDKDDNLSPFGTENSDKQGGVTVTKTPMNPDTAVSEDPPTRLPKDAGARAGEPSGPARRRSRDDDKPYDHSARSEHWRRMAVSWVVGECNGFGITSQARQWSELPTDVRLVMPSKIEAAITKATNHEQENLPLAERIIRAQLEQSLTDELRAFKPSSRADISSAHAA